MKWIRCGLRVLIKKIIVNGKRIIQRVAINRECLA